MTTITQPKPTSSAMTATGFAAARRATDEMAARTRGLMQDNLKPTTDAFATASGGAAALGRGNLEAVAEATQACLTGMQDLGRQYVAAMLGLTQHALDGAKGFAGVTSLQGAMALQADLARASVERALGEGARLQQAAMALTERVHAPLTRRATAVLERTTRARAA